MAHLPFLPPPEALAASNVAAAARPGPVLLRVFDAGERAALFAPALLLTFAGALGWGLLVLVRHAGKA